MRCIIIKMVKINFAIFFCLFSIDSIGQQCKTVEAEYRIPLGRESEDVMIKIAEHIGDPK